MAMSKMKRKKEKILHEAIVPRSVIEHTKSFTAPRGRMEMGGLLFGHVDSEGRNVCVVGFFPKQTQETPSYCEFEGKWLAIGAAAAVSANSKDNENDIPEIRVIGWIHTHPDLGIFLSGTDVSTFKQNMSFSPDGRFIAVVVDPLRGESGVFNDPNEAMIYSEPTGELELSPELEERYLMFLNEMESVREKLGYEELPFIIAGDLHRKHVSAGNPDDVMKSNIDSVHQVKRRLNLIEDSLEKIESNNVHILEKRLRSTEQGINTRMKVLKQGSDSIEVAISAFEEEAEERFENIEKEIMDLNNECKGQILGEVSKLNSEHADLRKILDSATHSQNASDLKINSLEDQNNSTKELLSHVLKDISEIIEIGKTVEIQKEAIRQLKRTIIELPTQIAIDSESRNKKQEEKWESFWDDLNSTDVTFDEIMGEHIGLIGTNQEFAIPFLKGKLGQQSPRLTFLERFDGFSKRLTKSVDRSILKLIFHSRRAITLTKEGLGRVFSYHQKEAT